MKAKSKTKRHIKWMREKRWQNKDDIRGRIYDLLNMRHPWWAWGHRLMVLTGVDFGGNWQEPKMETWFYRPVRGKRMRFTGYPRTKAEVIKGFDAFKPYQDNNGGWRAICFGQDNDLKLGRQYWGDGFYGLDSWEVPVVRAYLRAWNRKNWFGVRSWLYSLALWNAVNGKKPFSCQNVPPGDKGYSHWSCHLPKGHSGLHKYKNATW